MNTTNLIQPPILRSMTMEPAQASNPATGKKMSINHPRALRAASVPYTVETKL